MTVTTSEEFGRRAFLASLVSVLAAACTSTSGSESSGGTGLVESATSDGDASGATSTETVELAPTATPEPAEPVPTPTPAPVGPYPFTLGVASGDPDSQSVVLWTRLVPEPLTGLGLGDDVIDVLWEVATDTAFADVIASGIIDARPELGHSVHVIAPLPSDTWVWYRFQARGHVSTIGRTRSFPADDVSAPPLRFGVSSCQNFEQGHYAAHRALAEAGDDIDVFVFLGDYIYEYGPGTSAIEPARVHASPEAIDLGGYRNRYAQYRLDPNLQAHHATRPWVVTWDDHEVDNDYAGDVSQDAVLPEVFRARRAAAYQAWWEHMPVRLDPPSGPDWSIHREVHWGDLATLFMLDGRQYRDDQPADGEFVPIPLLAPTETDLIRALGPTSLDPDHTMLGPDQEAWLIEQAAATERPWSIVAQQVMMHGLSILPGASPPVTPTDTWDGYAGNRQRLLTELDQATDGNLVVLTGDFHIGTVGDLRPDPFDVSTPVVGTELMAPAISSRFADIDPNIVDLIFVVNPHVRHVQTDNGFLTCEVTAESLTARYHAVLEPADPDSNVVEAAVFEITAGTPTAKKLPLTG